MLTHSLVTQLRTAYAPFTCDSQMRGYSAAETRGQLAAMLVIIAGLSRSQALAAARVIV